MPLLWRLRSVNSDPFSPVPLEELSRRERKWLQRDAEQVQIRVRSHWIVLVPEIVCVMGALWLLLGGSDGRVVLATVVVDVLVTRALRQANEGRHVPRTRANRNGTRLYVVVGVGLVVSGFVVGGGGAVALLFGALLVHIPWRLAIWWLDETLVAGPRFYRLLGVVNDRGPRLEVAKFGPKSAVQSLLGRVLGYGDFVGDSPSEQDAELGWIRAVPRVAVFVAALDDNSAPPSPVLPVPVGPTTTPIPAARMPRSRRLSPTTGRRRRR